MTVAHVSFLARDGVRLEGLLQRPTDGAPCPAAVITHSHSLQAGGHMRAHVLRAVAERLAGNGIAALRINFRGVQGSAGVFDDGNGERQDVGGAVDFLRAHSQVDPERLALFGYSFGSRVCLPYAASDARIVAVATLGMPARRFLRAPVRLSTPILLVAGDNDHVVPPQHIEQFVSLHPTTVVRILHGTDHFYRGREDDVAIAVTEFLQAHGQPMMLRDA